MPIVSGVVVPKMFPLIHSVRDVYMVQYVMNVFLELTKITLRFRRLRRVTFAPKRIIATQKVWAHVCIFCLEVQVNPGTEKQCPTLDVWVTTSDERVAGLFH